MKIVQVKFDHPGQSFTDISGSNIGITKTGTFKPAPPLTSRTNNSILIENPNSLAINNIPIGIRSHEKESFSISFYAKFIKRAAVFTDIISFMFDSVNGIGFSIVKSNLVFQVTDKDNNITYVRHKLSSMSKKMLIKVVYLDNNISLSVDGIDYSQKLLSDDFKFKATQPITLSTPSSPAQFIMLDKIEIFNEPYLETEMDLDMPYQNPGQIISLDKGSYFSLSDKLKSIETGFSYGSNKFLSTANIVGLQEISPGYLALQDGLDSGYFTDSELVINFGSDKLNQIDWNDDAGSILVSYNLDGGSSYTTISNHSNIPGFSGGMIYYKVELVRNESQLESPIFRSFSFVAFSSELLFSDNTLQFLSSDYNYIVGRDLSSILDQSYNNGVETKSGGFKATSGITRSIEFMFMPSEISQTCLVDCGGTRYSWSGAGAITKTNISSIYVNGINLYSQTSVANVFIPGIWHHVVLTFNSDESDVVFFNQSKTNTLIGPNNRFSHIGIYDYDMSANAIKHYKSISSRISEATTSESVSIGQDSYSGFNVDKVVLSTQ
jgi:hypothetical protein